MNVSYEHAQSAVAPWAGRRNLWAAAAIGALVVALIVLFAIRLTHALGVKPASNKNTIPTVSVTEVGVSTVPSTVSIIGTIAARYDIPVERLRLWSISRYASGMIKFDRRIRGIDPKTSIQLIMVMDA